MDTKIISTRKSKLRLIKEFQLIDLIPYSIAFLMLLGDIYLILKFTHLPYVGID